VKFAGQVLQFLGDIASSSKDPLVSSSTVLVIYSLCFLLFGAELCFSLWETGQEIGRRKQREVVPDRP